MQRHAHNIKQRKSFRQRVTDTGETVTGHYSICSTCGQVKLTAVDCKTPLTGIKFRTWVATVAELKTMVAAAKSSYRGKKFNLSPQGRGGGTGKKIRTGGIPT